MKRMVMGLVVALAVLALSERPAHAGRIFLFAESASCGSLGVNCSKSSTSTVLDQYAYISGTDNTFTNSTWPFAIPPDAAATTTFSYRVHYETTDTGASKVCSFNVEAYAYPNNSAADAVNGAPSTIQGVATGASATHVGGKRYITSASSSVNVWNNNAGANCASSLCLNTSATLAVSINDTNTTATSCRIRMVEVIY